LVGSLTRKTIPDMTYNVFGGTLNLTQLNQCLSEKIIFFVLLTILI